MKWTGPRSKNIEDRRGKVTPPPEGYVPVPRLPSDMSHAPAAPTRTYGPPAPAPTLEEMLEELRNRSPRNPDAERIDAELRAKRDAEQLEADAQFERENRIAQLAGQPPRQRTNEPRVQFVGERDDALIYRDHTGKEISVPKTLVTR